MITLHQPVLLKEVVEYLNPKPGKNFIDCTIGGGGQALTILEHILPEGRLLGIDLSAEAIEELRKLTTYNSQLTTNLILVCDNFADLEKIVQKHNFKSIDGILLDLGLSSDLLEKSGRGFSFLKDEILDMRYHPNFQFSISNFQTELTAEEIVNRWSEIEIERILREFSQERFSRRIAKKIIENRKLKPIKTTKDLSRVIYQAIPSRARHQRIHFATRVFQALRIAVNFEIENLNLVLPQAVRLLNQDGKLVVISYHSLEDRLVKNFLKKEKRIKILTKKPIRPSMAEILKNPRSRSAKLRAGEKIINFKNYGNPSTKSSRDYSEKKDFHQSIAFGFS